MESFSKVVMFVLLLFFALYFFASKKYRFYTWYFVVALLVFESTVLFGPVENRFYFYVFSLGMLTAFSEIIGKFSDEPLKSLRTPHAVFYFIFNGLIAGFALYVLFLVIPKPADNANLELYYLQLALVAGLGSMLVMRSKLFSVKIADQDVAVGPEQIITVFFRFMEAEIDRVRAQSRIDFILTKMDNIDFEKVLDYSVTMLQAAPQSLDEEKQKNCVEEIGKLVSAGPEDKQLKSYRLGFFMLDMMGEGFVSKLFDNVQPGWQIRAPMPGRKEEGFLYKIPLFGSKTLPYMAYGPNMRRRKIREQLGWTDVEETKFHDATLPQKCVLKGYKLVFNKPAENSPAGLANIRESEGSEIEGVVYQLSKEAIDFLDINERGYRRTQLEAMVAGKQVEVQIYIAESQQEGLKPDKEYLDLILEGATEHQLSESYLATIQAALPGEGAKEQPAATPAVPAAPANQSETTAHEN